MRRYDVSCSDYSDGLNTVLKANDVGDRYSGRTPIRQCVKCLDIFLHNNKRRPAVKALATIAGRIVGLGSYLRYSGDDNLLVSHGNLLSIADKTDGSLTQVADFGGSGEAWFANWLDKCFVCNGTKNIKVEGTNSYQIGITPPSGVAAAASAGGALADGVYKIYAGYARRESGVNVLYSSGQSIADVTLGGGNNTISISNFANSVDPQVGNKVIWMTDAGNSTYYLYAQTGDNTTTAFTIASDAGKIVSIIYSVAAMRNNVPPAFSYIFAHDKRIWGSNSNALYFSLQEGNVYDLDRFDTVNNFINFPFEIQGIFAIGADLYVNTPGGIFRQPQADTGARYERVLSNTGRPLYFKYFRTVASWSGAVIGLTNDGVQVFDGERWSGDLTKDIRAEIDRIYNGYNAAVVPCGAVYRRDSRMEYHLSYHDRQVSSGMNNRRLILNLDKVSLSQDGPKAPWDMHTNGANYLSVDSSETMFSAQANETTSVIYKDRTDRMVDEGIYKGNSIATGVPAVIVRSGTFVPDLTAYVRLRQTRTLAKFLKAFGVRFQIVSRSTPAALTSFEPNSEGTFQLNVSRLGVNRLVANEPIWDRQGLPPTLKGPAFYVEFTQTEEDKEFELLDLTVHGTVVKTRKT
jgi:hypothetical protein